ncbi:unnamed protein product [Gongylonema pulchrum]|uniref:Transposase n=1 Tax=Gongylonema pulchrum TaxID=637853 RepID=A0A183EIT3_9BILA|nr:unnamed protein product [Gongylonema pulchrum]
MHEEWFGVKYDSDSELEPAEYERRREIIATKMVIIEKMYAETKQRIYEEKMKLASSHYS